MNGWDALSLGVYDIKERYIGLDYATLFLDPIRAEITLAHEASHSVMAESDIGQGARNIAQTLPHYTHLSDSEKAAIVKCLRDSQIFVQEGFATFMEIGRLRTHIGNARALRWASEHLHPEYKERFDRLAFAFSDLSHKYREAFSSKLPMIAMETGFRKHVYEQDLLAKAGSIEKYLAQADLNPNRRLEKILELLRFYPWKVMKSPEEIAEAAGITYYKPLTKEEVANHLTYLTSFTPYPRTFDPSEIGNTLSGEELFRAAFKSVQIRNINSDIANTAITLPSLGDLLHYSSVIEVIFVTEAGKNQVYKHLQPRTNPDHEIAVLAFCKTGEKYLSVMSRLNATKTFNEDLNKATLMTKQGGINIVSNRPALSPTVRPPNVVIYNSPELLKNDIEVALKERPDLKFSYRHIGASAEHPYQTIAVFVEGQSSLHIATGFGNKDITEAILLMSGRSRVFTDQEMLNSRKHINNYLSSWMGLSWEIDWGRSMVEGDDLYPRLS